MTNRCNKLKFMGNIVPLNKHLFFQFLLYIYTLLGNETAIQFVSVIQKENEKTLETKNLTVPGLLDTIKVH
jgi:hypothetical protein